MLDRVKFLFATALQAWRHLLGLRRKGKRRGSATRSKRERARLKESLPPDDLEFEPSPPINPARSKVDSTVVDFDSPAIVAMERRALRQIFDHLDLAMVPGWAFVALDQTRDPVMAFKLFAMWVGVDPLAARDREHIATSRIALAIELLSELAPLRSLLTEDGDRRLCDALRDNTGPDPLSRLRNHMEHVTAAAKLHRVGSRMEELPSCILASRMRAIINEIIGDPLATTKPEIEDGIEMGERLEEALRALEALQAEVTHELELLHDAYWNGTLSGDHATWCDKQADAFDCLLDEIMTDDSLGVIGVEERVKQAEVIRDSLLTMRDYPGGGPDGRRATHRLSPIEEVEEALAAVGLSRKPTLIPLP